MGCSVLLLYLNKLIEQEKKLKDSLKKKKKKMKLIEKQSHSTEFCLSTKKARSSYKVLKYQTIPILIEGVTTTSLLIVYLAF